MGEYLLMLIPEEPALTSSQIKVLVDIFVGVGMVSTGSVVLPAVLDKWSPVQILLGLTAAFYFWSKAVVMARRIGI